MTKGRRDSTVISPRPLTSRLSKEVFEDNDLMLRILETGVHDVELHCYLNPGGHDRIWGQLVDDVISIFIPSFHATSTSVKYVASRVTRFLERYLEIGEDVFRGTRRIKSPKGGRRIMTSGYGLMPVGDIGVETDVCVPLSGTLFHLARMQGMFNIPIGPDVNRDWTSRYVASSRLARMYYEMGLRFGTEIPLTERFRLRPMAIPMKFTKRLYGTHGPEYVPYAIRLELVCGDSVAGWVTRMEVWDDFIVIDLADGFSMSIPYRKRTYCRGLWKGDVYGAPVIPIGFRLELGDSNEGTDEGGASETPGDMEVMQEADHESEMQGLCQIRRFGHPYVYGVARGLRRVREMGYGEWVQAGPDSGPCVQYKRLFSRELPLGVPQSPGEQPHHCIVLHRRREDAYPRTVVQDVRYPAPRGGSPYRVGMECGTGNHRAPAHIQESYRRGYGHVIEKAMRRKKRKGKGV